ncbi:unnamed protein product, partial [Allacma fusca]
IIPQICNRTRERDGG